MKAHLTFAQALPADAGNATLIGRAWLPDAHGPAVVAVQDGAAYDLSAVAVTASALLNLDDPVAAVRSARGLPRVGTVDDLLANSASDTGDSRAPWLLAPCDLQAVKASTVAMRTQRIAPPHTECT